MHNIVYMHYHTWMHLQEPNAEVGLVCSLLAAFAAGDCGAATRHDAASDQQPGHSPSWTVSHAGHAA